MPKSLPFLVSLAESNDSLDVIFDVCATCHANATCVQKDGKDICECNYGFTGNGRTICHDKNECLSGICGEHAVCHNTHGSYYCVCHVGFQASNKHGTFIPNDGTKCIGNTHIFVLSPASLEIDCGKPPWLPNADIIWDNSTTLGSTVYYKCKDGFQSFGEHNFSQCTISHKWENITFECKEIICGQPPVLSFSNMIWNGATHPGSTVEYNCMKGFYSTGTKSHSVCSRNGSWEMLDLRCKKKTIFNNISIFNDTCIKWHSAPGRRRSEETYLVSLTQLESHGRALRNIFFTLLLMICLIMHFLLQIHLVGLRWYQKEFSHETNLNFTTDSWNPELCLNLSSGSNYTVNISSADRNHSVLIHLSVPLAGRPSISFLDPPSPQVEFMSTRDFIPLLSFLKVEGRNGPISSYQVIVIPGIPLCNFNCYSLTNLSYFSQGSESDSYVTAEFSAQSIPENRLTFVLGDRLYYGGFYNAPLKPRKAYCIVLRTVSKWNGVRRLLKFRWN
uniref:Sushi domain containing 1 n=1 Tax=Pseudonaja textilis TaxID=8673 RepID=A0A670ZMW0_PSETE